MHNFAEISGSFLLRNSGLGRAKRLSIGGAALYRRYSGRYSGTPDNLSEILGRTPSRILRYRSILLVSFFLLFLRAKRWAYTYAHLFVPCYARNISHETSPEYLISEANSRVSPIDRFFFFWSSFVFEPFTFGENAQGQKDGHIPMPIFLFPP